MSTLQIWETLNESEKQDWRVFTVKKVGRRHPISNRVGEFTVCQAPRWVNILPITTSGKVVLVEQYRHGTNSVTLEIPGGIANVDEDLRLAAQRECLEETGFGAVTEAELLGIIQPNPAFMSNECNVYVWRNCERLQDQQLDPFEDIAVREVDLEEFLKMVSDGRIQHSLVVGAAAFYLLRERNQK